jgi:hypothetical protein
LIVSIGGKKDIALVDSGSTDSFMDYLFASKLNYELITTTSQRVKVVVGGYLDSSAMITDTPYIIQTEKFTGAFRL